MAKKRGGAAGLWDRNKGWLKSVVPAALGAIPGVGVPLAVGAGAAMRGLDRPGKRGIGLDVGEAARGAAEGYGMGKLGQGARAGLQGMFAPKAASVPDALSMDLGIGKQAMAPMSSGRMPAMSGGMDLLPTTGLPPEPPPSPLRRAGGAVKSATTKALDTATKYEKPLSMLVEGVAGGVPSAEVETARARNVLDERRFEEELRLQKLREERQALLAELLMPILNSRMSERGFGQEGYQGIASMQGAVPGFGRYIAPATSSARSNQNMTAEEARLGYPRSR